MNAGMQGPVGTGDVCLVAPGGGCVPDEPIFYTIGASAGWENASGTARVLAGAASMQADGGGRAIGVQARLDGTTPALLHLAAVFALRGTVMPNYRGATLVLLAFGVGVRLR